MTASRLTWARATDRYPDAATDSFIALDGETEVGFVKLIPAPAGKEWTPGAVGERRPVSDARAA